MKYFLISISLIAALFTTQANALEQSTNSLSKEAELIAQRLAPKDINEVVQLVLNLQIECQRSSSEDVCDGVGKVVEVLEYRLTAAPNALNTDSYAFIDGLIHGVKDANKKVREQLHRVVE